MRTFQEIYDFCRNDRTYRTYYDVPDQFACTQNSIGTITMMYGEASVGEELLYFISGVSSLKGSFVG